MNDKLKKTYITAYDFFSGRIAADSGVDGILVGDSLGMTVYGFADTKSVTVDMIISHAQAVRRGVEQSKNPNTQIIVDMPFCAMSDMMSIFEAAETFANDGFMILKIEGGTEHISLFMELINRGYSIMGHLGLTPQTSELRVHGREKKEEEQILSAIQSFDSLGIQQIVLECVPESLGKKTQKLFSGDIIGIGAGRNVNAQILVFDDTVGRTVSDFSPKFLKRFGNAYEVEKKSIEQYISSVKSNEFPGEEHCYI